MLNKCVGTFYMSFIFLPINAAFPHLHYMEKIKVFCILFQSKEWLDSLFAILAISKLLLNIVPAATCYLCSGFKINPFSFFFDQLTQKTGCRRQSKKTKAWYMSLFSLSTSCRLRNAEHFITTPLNAHFTADLYLRMSIRRERYFRYCWSPWFFWRQGTIFFKTQQHKRVINSSFSSLKQCSKVILKNKYLFIFSKHCDVDGFKI